MLYLFLQLWEIMINGVEAFLYYLPGQKENESKRNAIPLAENNIIFMLSGGIVICV